MDDLTQLTDEQLATRCRKRPPNRDALVSELLRRHQGRVWQTCYQLFGNAQDAEDMTQETLIRAYRSLDRFEGRASFASWLHRIATNVCYNEYRTRRRRPVTESGIDVSSRSDGGESPETRLATGERQRMLSTALSRLRSDDLQLVLWVDFENRPYAEIAEELGLGSSATKMRVQRARLALQKTYLELTGDSP